MALFRNIAFALLVLPLFFAQAPAYALNSTDQATMQQIGQIMNSGNAPQIVQRLYLRLSQMSLDVANGSLDALIHEHTLVVMGSSADGTEWALLQSAQSSYPQLQNATFIQDSAGALKIAESGKYLVIVLIGGPSQNSVTKAFQGKSWLNESEQVYDQFTVQYGQNENGTLVIVFSDKKGFGNAARESVKYSPLSAILPPAYVPPAATGISLLLLTIIGLAGNVFGNKINEYGQKGRKIGEGSVFVAGLNLSEIAAVALSALVLGIAISWQYFGPSPEFLFWVFVDAIICLVAAVSHEAVHRIFAMIFKLKVEYRFWTAGSAITLLSSYLGNAFSTQGFLMEEYAKNTPKWKIGVTKLAAPLFSNGIMLLAGGINVFFPSVVFQTIYATSGLLALAEMLPFQGMDGKNIKDWNVFVWLLGFLFIAGCYVFVVFLL